MSIPMYDKNDLVWAEKDGAYHIMDFSNFLDELLNSGGLEEGTKEYGIVAKANDVGTKELSEKQLYVLEQVVEPYTKHECLVCGLNIPLNEVIHSEDTGLCSYHACQADKNDD